MKKTIFYNAHTEMGGKMVPFAGYEMPLEFSGIRNEHNCVRKGVGIFDVSHMGEIWATGPKAEQYVQMLTTNDVRKLSPGKVQYSCFPNGKGGIVDDLLVYEVDENRYLLVVNASNIDKDWAWLLHNKIEDVELVNESDNTSQLAVQGPDAHKVLQKLSSLNLGEIPYFSFKFGNIAKAENVLISNTGYTGSGGFELYFKNEDGPGILSAIMEAGKEYNIMPTGLAARDTLRLESGYCLYGNDIDDTTSPLEAGLAWITRFVEGNEFIDRKYLEKQKDSGIKRRLVGFELNERGIPRNGYPILDDKGIQIGRVTSGTMSPLTSKAIGMGYVQSEFSGPGSIIYIEIRNKHIPATVVKPPFF
jgi:aminomethyltransferase